MPLISLFVHDMPIGLVVAAALAIAALLKDAVLWGGLGLAAAVYIAAFAYTLRMGMGDRIAPLIGIGTSREQIRRTRIFSLKAAGIMFCATVVAALILILTAIVRSAISSPSAGS